MPLRPPSTHSISGRTVSGRLSSIGKGAMFRMAPMKAAQGTARRRIPLVLLMFAMLGAALPAGRTDRLSWEMLPAQDSEGRALGTLVVSSILGSGTSDAQRPTLIVFNGGPGASSAWLQLGLLGPLQADLPADPAVPIPSEPRLRAAPGRIGDLADVLFVDPLDTGFSRRAANVEAKRVRTLDADGDYLARAIALWLVRHDRVGQPVVLVGESYGAERAVAVADAWQRTGAGIHLAGLVLISQTVLNEFALSQEDRALALATGLPTLAATACYHGLVDGAAHDPDACAEQAAASDTLATKAVFANGSRPISRNAYRMVALQDRQRALGRYDSRRTAPVDPRRGWQDPSLAPLLQAMSHAMPRYNRALLGLTRSPVDGSAYVLYDPLIRATWQPTPGGAYGLADRLGTVLRTSGARLLVAGGLFDCVGSVGADRLLLSRLGLPPGIASAVRYPGGHMFYLDPQNRTRFRAHLERFLRDFAPGRPSRTDLPASPEKA